MNPRLKDWQVRNQCLNFPMQATCAEILRWACVYAIEDGVSILAPVHDAILVGGPVGEIEDIVHRTRVAMDKASALVLEGLVMRTDAKIVKHPDRLLDARGIDTWNRIVRMVDEIEREQSVAGTVAVVR